VKIVFFGTPEFAVQSLDKIIEAGFDVAAVVTSADKPSGRGLSVNMSDVKKYALEKGIDVLQPTNLKNPEFQKTLQNYGADLFVIIAFRMLPEAVWNMPKFGSINLHASLLPQYRGAAPINHAIINGEKETGVTTFFLQHEIDTGDLIAQEKVIIEPTDNAGILHHKLKNVGAELMVKTLKMVAENSYQLTPQNFDKALKIAPKLSKEYARIEWKNSAENIQNKIRGLSPYPASWTTINAKQLKIFSSEIIEQNSDLEIITDKKKYLYKKCNDNYISLLEVQLEGKKRMLIEDFLRGWREDEMIII